MLCAKCVYDKMVKHWFRPIEFKCTAPGRKESFVNFESFGNEIVTCEAYEPTEKVCIEGKDW